VAVLAGLLNLTSALLPAERDRLRLLDDLVPGAVSQGATVAVAATGIGLLLLAGGLRRRHRTAWLAAVALLAGSAALNVVMSLDVEQALVEAFLAGLLAGQVGRFPARAARGERPPLLGPALTVLTATVAYGMLGLVVNDHDVRADRGLGGMLAEAGRMALGLGTGVPLGGRFGRLFPSSVAAVFYVGALVVVARLLAPALTRRAADPGLAAAVVASDDSLAYFALRDDRATVRAGDALVAYGTVRSVALAAGDPLGPPEQWPAAIGAFLDEMVAQGRAVAVLGCGAPAAAAWRAAGLTTIYLGDEAVLDLDRFTLEGRAVRIARQSWNRARRAGFTSLVCRSRDLDHAQAAALGELSRRWRGEAVERGFSMTLGRLLDRRDPDTLVVAAADAAGLLWGFLHFVPWGAEGASLDVMRRDRHAPSWLNDFLVVEAARRLPELGVRRVSLNFSFLRAVLAAGRPRRCPGGCGRPGGCCDACPARSRSSRCTASTASSRPPGSPATSPSRCPRNFHGSRWPPCGPRGCSARLGSSTRGRPGWDRTGAVEPPPARGRRPPRRTPGRLRPVLTLSRVRRYRPGPDRLRQNSRRAARRGRGDPAGHRLPVRRARHPRPGRGGHGDTASAAAGRPLAGLCGP
jgi:lysyl-tRNA synthetase class 2